MLTKSGIHALSDEESVVVSGGAITLTQSVAVVSASSGTTDTVNTITISPGTDLLGSAGNYSAAVYLRPATGHTITFAPGGNILIADNIPITGDDIIMAFYDRTNVRLIRTVLETNPVDPSVFPVRMSLEAMVKVSSSDVSSSPYIYIHPYNGNKIALWNGSIWEYHPLTTAITVNSSGLIANTNYDVFLYESGGFVAAEVRGWNSDTARVGHYIDYQNNIPVLNSNKTRRYVGTARTSATSTWMDTANKRFLWNYYNRVDRRLMKAHEDLGGGTTTIILGSSSGAWSEAITVDNIKVEFVSGLKEDSISASYNVWINMNAVVSAFALSMDGAVPGVNARAVHCSASTAMDRDIPGSWEAVEGYHRISPMYITGAGAVTTLYGYYVSGSIILKGGIIGMFRC